MTWYIKIKTYKKYYKTLFFISLLLLIFLINFYKQTFILTDNLYRMLIGSKMTERQLEDYLELIRKWYWVSYLFIPIMLLLRISFAWLCLKVGSFITESFNDSSFWKICIQAEIVFAVGSVTSLLYTELFIDVETLEQLSVNPFSLQVFASSSMPKWCAYFFNTLNIFEVCYVAFLAYLISEESKKTFMSTLKFVTTSYLPALMLWVLFVSYFSLIFQP